MLGRTAASLGRLLKTEEAEAARRLGPAMLLSCDEDRQRGMEGVK